MSVVYDIQQAIYVSFYIENCFDGFIIDSTAQYYKDWMRPTLKYYSNGQLICARGGYVIAHLPDNWMIG